MKRGENKKTYEIKFHKWKSQLLYFDKILIIVILSLLLWMLRPDYFLIAVYILIFPYLILTDRKELVYHLLVASIIALIWMIYSYDLYAYERDTIIIYGLNSYALFTWALGLFSVYIIYSHWDHVIYEPNFLKRLLVFTAFYWPLLIFSEYIAYNLFNIINLKTVIYSGLPLCNCLHAPEWMKIIYFMIGPIYFSVCDLIGLENPHWKKI